MSSGRVLETDCPMVLTASVSPVTAVFIAVRRLLSHLIHLRVEPLFTNNPG